MALPFSRPPLAAALVAATLATAAVPPVPAEAQPPMPCGKRDALVAQLEGRYGETRRSVGLQSGRGIVETYANDKTGSWTILVTTPDGLSCLVAAGEAFRAVEPGPVESPA